MPYFVSGSLDELANRAQAHALVLKALPKETTFDFSTNQSQFYTLLHYSSPDKAHQDIADVIQKDIFHRTNFLGDASHWQHFVAYWMPEGSNNTHYIQGDPCGGNLFQLFLSKAPFNQFLFKDLNESFDNYEQQKQHIDFAYLADDGQTVHGISIHYRKDDPSQWLIGMSQQAYASPTERQVAIFSTLALDDQVPSVDVNTGRNQLLQQTGSKNINQLLTAIIQPDGTIRPQVCHIEQLIKFGISAEKAQAERRLEFEGAPFFELYPQTPVAMTQFLDNPVIHLFVHHCISLTPLEIQQCLDLDLQDREAVIGLGIGIKMAHDAQIDTDDQSGQAKRLSAIELFFQLFEQMTNHLNECLPVNASPETRQQLNALANQRILEGLSGFKTNGMRAWKDQFAAFGPEAAAYGQKVCRTISLVNRIRRLYAPDEQACFERASFLMQDTPKSRQFFEAVLAVETNILNIQNHLDEIDSSGSDRSERQQWKKEYFMTQQSGYRMALYDLCYEFAQRDEDEPLSRHESDARINAIQQTHLSELAWDTNRKGRKILSSLTNALTLIFTLSIANWVHLKKTGHFFFFDQPTSKTQLESMQQSVSEMMVR